MERSSEIELWDLTAPLGFFERLELAKAHCALVFEERGGRLTDGDVVAVARRWTVSGRDRSQLDADLLAGHLFAWLG
jgi:hypothetical protein